LQAWGRLELPGVAHRHHVGVGRVVVAELLAGVVDADAVLVVDLVLGADAVVDAVGVELVLDPGQGLLELGVAVADAADQVDVGVTGRKPTP
jgi:hypothetical protein